MIDGASSDKGDAAATKLQGQWRQRNARLDVQGRRKAALGTTVSAESAAGVQAAGRESEAGSVDGHAGEITADEAASDVAVTYGAHNRAVDAEEDNEVLVQDAIPSHDDAALFFFREEATKVKS